MKKYTRFLKLWNATASILMAIFLISASLNAQSIDLELSLTSPNASPGIFGNVTVTATVINTGSGTATNVMLEFPTFPSDLPVTGDPMETQGFFSNWWTGTATWDVGTLEAGASASVEIGLFPLAENIDFYGEVTAVNGNDSDSSPGNGTSPNPNEDDEAAIRINDTGGGTCELTALVSNIICDDNGTSNDDNDDLVRFDLTVNGQNTSGDWIAQLPLPSGGSNFITGAVGTTTPIVYNINAVNQDLGGIIEFLVEDSNDASCSTNVAVTPPSTCSNGGGPCDFTADVYNIQCFDNGTPTVPSDDVWSFDFNAIAVDNDNAYIANIDGQSFFGTFNQSTSFGLFPIADGDVTLTISDLSGISCGSPINIAAPSPCSNGGSNGMDLELSISSPTTNPTIYSNGTIVVSVANTGTIAATDVQIEIPSPQGYIYQGGNEFTASQGGFSATGTQVWTVGTIAAGDDATIELNYFFLADPNGIANYAQVINASETDTDSTPGNGTCCTPNEDDEAVFTFGGMIATPDLTVSDFNENWPTPLAIGVEYPFVFDLKNIGAATATGNYRVGVYFSTDGFLDAGDYLIGEIATGDTPVGTITAVPGLVEVTADVPSDTYFVLLVADDLNDILETNENNNIQVSNDTYSVDNSGNTCTGIFVATSQTELNQFDPTCTTWAGAIELSGNITDLSPLANLENILGNITFEGTQVANLDGLSNLQSLGALFLFGNTELNSIAGLSPNLEVGSIQIINSAQLNSIGNLPISNTTTNLTIANNPALTSLAGLQNLTGNYPNLELTLASLSNITSLSDLQNITQLKRLSISQFAVLLSLNGLDNLAAIENLNISGNANLADCCAIFELLNNNGVSGTANIANNEMGCNSAQDIIDTCSPSGCQITATILDIQCQSNLTLTNNADDTYTARVLIEGTSDCFGNYKIDGELGGVFGSPAIFGQIASIGPFPISGGDVTVTITDFNDEGAIQLNLTAPSACSDGVDANECGFENTYPISGALFSPTLPHVTETGNGYELENLVSNGGLGLAYDDLSIDFAGEQTALTTISQPSNAFDRADDGDFFTGEFVPLISANTIAIRKLTPNGAVVWSQTVTFDSGGPQSAPSLRDAITLSDGYAFLAGANGPQDIIWILKTDFDGNVIYNNQLMLTDGLLSLNFDQLANNGDFIIYRQGSSRTGYLVRVSASGDFLFEEGIVGDLVSNRFGGFDETPDGNFIYASYLEFPFPVLEKVDAFTGERQWKIRLTDVFSPDSDFTFGSQADVVATNDGGAVVGYSTSSPVGVPSAYEYGKVNASGNLVWSRLLPEIYSLNAKLATSDGGVLFVGTIDDEYAVVKTTSEGLLTPTCTSGGGNCNLSVDVDVSPCDNNGTPNDPSDDTFTYQYVVINPGSTASGFVPVGLGVSGNYGEVFSSIPNNIIDFGNNPSAFMIADASDPTCITTFSIVPPAACSNGGGNGIDLEMSIGNTPGIVTQWSFISVDFIVSNNGTAAETGIEVEIPLPNGLQYKGGDEFATMNGSFSPYGGNIWSVGSLGAGELATLTVNYFVVTSDMFTFYAQVSAQDGTDTDSTPGNGTCCTATEDDELVFEIFPTTSQPLIGQNGTNVSNESSFLIGKIYPNPATNLLNIELESNEERAAFLQIINASGQSYLQKEMALERGQTALKIEVQNLPRGVYFLKVETENGVVVERFLKQ
jgi:hypothetical protein